MAFLPENLSLRLDDGLKGGTTALEGAELEDAFAVGVGGLVEVSLVMRVSTLMLGFLETGGRAVPWYPVMVELELDRGFGVGSCGGLDSDLDRGLGGVVIEGLLCSVGLVEGMPWEVFCLMAFCVCDCAPGSEGDFGRWPGSMSFISTASSSLSESSL